MNVSQAFNLAVSICRHQKLILVTAMLFNLMIAGYSITRIPTTRTTGRMQLESGERIKWTVITA